MDLKKILSSRHSKEMVLEIRDYIGDDKKKFKSLMNLFFLDEWQLNQRSSWAILKTIQKHPKLIQPYLPKLLKKLDEKVHDAVIRNTIRIFEEIEEIPEDIEGILYDKCYQYLSSMDSPIAVKAFSLTVASKFAMKYPDLQGEILELIDYQLPHSTAAFKVRARKTRALFKKNEKKDN